jgi:hypothetical protein
VFNDGTLVIIIIITKENHIFCCWFDSSLVFYFVCFAAPFLIILNNNNLNYNYHQSKTSLKPTEFYLLSIVKIARKCNLAD